jgi:hypothetical protein
MSERVLDEHHSGVASWLRQLDGLLRGEATRLSALRNGTINIRPTDWPLSLQFWA